MAKSRDASQIVATDINGVVSELNFILQRIFDRLDKLEGLRDSFGTEGSGEFGGAVSAASVSIADSSETVVHSLGSE